MKENQPLVSVIVPTKNSSKFLEACLLSIKNQTYKNIEIIVVIPKVDIEFSELSQKYNFNLIYCNEGKNASRNKGSEIAKGEYLLHIDDDMRLSEEVVSESVSLATNENYKAVAIPETEEKSRGIYNKIRILEKIIASTDSQIEAPRFIEKKIFNELHQIDVRLDPIDEGDLKAKLEERKIFYVTTKANITLSSENRMSSLCGRWAHMYQRGQKMPLFNLLHPNSNQLKPAMRIRPYIQKSGLLLANNIVGISLLVIKAADLLFLKSGSRNINAQDKKIISDLKNKIIFEKEAGLYQKEFFENTIGAQYVDKMEKQIVEKYLKNFDKNSHIKILDIGPGGGRWSELMLNYFPNSDIVACDLSEGMVKELEQKYKKEPRFKAGVGDMQMLPFEDGLFDLVISIRAIKYATNQKMVFEEISRVLAPGGKGIIELPYLNFVYRIIRRFKIFGKISEYANRIVLSDQKEIKEALENVNFKICNFDRFSAIPATFYKNCKSKSYLLVLNIIDLILPKYIFGRSLFIYIKKNNLLKVGINSRIYQQSKTGIPYYIECLYRQLIGESRDLSYVFFQTSLNKNIGVTRVIKGSNTGLFAAVFDMYLVNRLIKKENINIFHGPSNILPFFKVKGVKYALTIHDLSFLIFPNNHSFLFNLYYKYGIKRSLKNADIIIAISENTKKDILHFYNVPEEKIKVIYSGINNFVLNRTKTIRIVKEDYFFSLTTHPRRKNIVSVLEVMSRYSELKKYKYVVAGLISDTQIEEMEKLVRKLGLVNNVIVWGYATEDELVNFYQNAEFFIFPSFYEGFGFPVLEAMACKCPVITSNNSSLIEITLDKNWLVDPYNLEDISNKMISMIRLGKDERNELIEANFNFSKQFNWDKTAEEYTNLFKNLK